MRRSPHPLVDRARRTLEEIQAGKPGDRFTAHWRARRESARERPLRRAFILGLGVFFVLVGLVLGLVPFTPGFLIGVPGLAILAVRFKALARLLDSGEVLLRRCWRGLCRLCRWKRFR